MTKLMLPATLHPRADYGNQERGAASRRVTHPGLAITVIWFDTDQSLSGADAPEEFDAATLGTVRVRGSGPRPVRLRSDEKGATTTPFSSPFHERQVASAAHGEHRPIPWAPSASWLPSPPRQRPPLSPAGSGSWRRCRLPAASRLTVQASRRTCQGPGTRGARRFPCDPARPVERHGRELLANRRRHPADSTWPRDCWRM